MDKLKYGKINTGQELLTIVCKSMKTVIVGKGWIERLTACYIEKYAQKNLESIDIEDIYEEGDIQNTFIIARQEKQGEKLAEDISNIYEGNFFYLSNGVKDEMDRMVMADYPDIYENEVLLARKKELDETMSCKFSRQIKDILEMSEFPIFQEIEIETINRCNGTCSFCPINRIDDSRPFIKMKDELFKSIILQLASMEYKGRIGLYSNNEPLLDKRIVDFAHFAWEQLPDACKIIYTNGTLLTRELFVQLLQYMDILCVDLYYDEQEDEVMTDSMKDILHYGIKHTDVQEKVMVQFINRRAIRNNRGGKSKNRKKIYQVNAACMLPYIQMIVRPDGKLSLCCNDALGENTLGDLNSESLMEAWHNSRYQIVRERIAQGRQNMGFCRNCDNYGSVNIKGNEEFSKEEMRRSWDELKVRLGEI